MKKWLLCFIMICSSFFLPLSLCAAEEKGHALYTNNPDGNTQGEVEISSFEARDDAEKLAVKVRHSGFEAAVRPYATKEGRTVYGVFVIVHGEQEGTPGAAAGQTEEKPAGVSRTPKDIFARKASFFHAALTMQGIYTDNAFNSNTDRKSDFSTVYSPEFWVSAPRLNQRPEALGDISPQSPGGLLLGRTGYDLSRRYQAYFHYQADIPQHTQNSPSGNTTVHTAEGGFAYNLASGISFDLRDTFLRSYETVDTSALAGPGEVDRYKGNLFYLLTAYDTDNRFRVRFDYSNFLIRYDAERNFPRNRTDNSFSGYLYYKLKAKTSLFVQYSFIDIGYEEETKLNSAEQNFYGGIQWELTAKSRGSVKAGYGIKDFSAPGTKNNTFIFEVNVDHRFTPKTSLSLAAFRKTDETNISSAIFVLAQGASAKYQQMLTSRITGSAGLSYANEKYGADLTIGGTTARRTDNLYQGSLGFQYEFRKWLRLGIMYVYTKNDSNFPEFNYSSNAMFFRVTGSL